MLSIPAAANNPWEKIYQSPKQYSYYNLLKPHEALKEIIPLFHSRNVKNILDLGCGLGRNLIPLAYEKFNVIGVDPSSNALQKLRKQLKKLHLNARLIKGKFQSIPMPDNSIDALISVQVLNHGTEKEVKKGIYEIARVVRPKGLIFITVPGRIANGKVRYCLVRTAQKIEERTFVPTQGNEIGQPHFIYNKKLLFKHFQKFKIKKIWRDKKDYYCLLGEK